MTVFALFTPYRLKRSAKRFDYSFVRGAAPPDVRSACIAHFTPHQLDRGSRRFDYSFRQGPIAANAPLGCITVLTPYVPKNRRRLPLGFMGWMNADNENASFTSAPENPPLGVDRHDYNGIQWFPIYVINREYCLTDWQPLPLYRYIDTSFAFAPIQASSVEAATRSALDVPQYRSRYEYAGWRDFTGERENVLDQRVHRMEVDLPPYVRDRHRYDGWMDNVATRDETGDLIEIRSPDFWTTPPYARDRHQYDGWRAEPIPQEVEDNEAGFIWFDAPPAGFDTRDYGGFQHRSDFEQLREPPVAGFFMFDLPPTGPNTFFDIRDYFGARAVPVPEDFIPIAGKIWRPIFRPRRR